MGTESGLSTNHLAGRGVAFDCAEWGNDIPPERWSRGKLVSNHVSGRGVAVDCAPRLRIVLTLALRPDADRAAIRTKLEEMAADLSEIDTSLGGGGFRVDEDESGERPNQTYQFVLSTGDDGPTERVKMLAGLLAVLAAKANGKNTASVRVVTTDAATAQFQMAA